MTPRTLFAGAHFNAPVGAWPPRGLTEVSPYDFARVPSVFPFAVRLTKDCSSVVKTPTCISKVTKKSLFCARKSAAQEVSDIRTDGFSSFRPFKKHLATQNSNISSMLVSCSEAEARDDAARVIGTPKLIGRERRVFDNARVLS